MIALTKHDALIIVDVQNDFLPGGSLAVPEGEQVVPVLNHYLTLFVHCALPVYATRDWHPPDHCSFRERGGIWPPHCIARSNGAAFPTALDLPVNAVIVSKATRRERDAYSGFEGTELADRLRAHHIERLFIGGLATDYCVLNTTLDALREGFTTMLLTDAIRAVELHPGDGRAAIDRMVSQGARPITIEDIED